MSHYEETDEKVYSSPSRAGRVRDPDVNGSVTQNFEKLSDTIDRLDSSIHKLLHLLEPILLPEDSEGVVPRHDDPRDRIKSDLAERIENKMEWVDRLGTLVNQTIQRVDL